MSLLPLLPVHRAVIAYYSSEYKCKQGQANKDGQTGNAYVAPVLEVAHLQTINGYTSLPKFQAIHHVIS
jgi:hypothetical protein